MKFGMTSNNSPYKIFTAGASLDGGFKAVTLGEGGLSLGGDYPIGLTSAETETIQAGEDVNICLSGQTLWQLGSSIQAGAALSSDSLGCAIPSSSGKFILARSLEDGVADEVVQVLITREGYTLKNKN